MDERTCEQCCGTMAGKTKRARFCSRACAQRRRAANRPSPACRTCGTCGASLEGRPGQTRYCDRVCSSAAERERYRTPTPSRECEYCHGTFESARSEARFCGKSCWGKSYRARNLDKITEYQRMRRRESLDQYREARRARWTAERAEHFRKYLRQWAKDNPDKVLLYSNRRRGWKAAAGVFVITERDWRRLVERYRGCCAYCGEPSEDGKLQCEHVIPLVRGGRHSIGNLLPACRSCNSRKNRLLLTEWRHREGVLARAC